MGEKNKHFNGEGGWMDGNTTVMDTMFVEVLVRIFYGYSDEADILRVIKCKNLDLSLVPPEVGSSSSNESESDCCPESNGMVMETCKKIPSAPLHRKESLYSSFNSGSSMCLDQTTARSALADEEVKRVVADFSSTVA